MVDGRSSGADSRTWPVDDVESGAAQSTQHGAVDIVPGLGQTQQIDVTVAAQFSNVVEQMIRWRCGPVFTSNLVGSAFKDGHQLAWRSRMHFTEFVIPIVKK